MFEPDLGLLEKHGGQIHPKLIGVKKASTFPGFCNTHDKQLFSPIEDHPFNESDLEHVFLLSYRAACRELHAKLAQSQHLATMRTYDKGRPLSFEVAFQRFVSTSSAGALAGLNDARHMKCAMDEMLVQREFGQLQYVVACFNGDPPFLCCGAKCLTHDFHGHVLKNLSKNLDTPADWVAFAIIPTDIGWASTFCWLRNTDCGRSFGTSLTQLDLTEMPGAVARFTFEHFENTCIAPVWWATLKPDHRKSLAERVNRAASLLVARQSDCLVDDGIRCVEATALSVKANVS